MQRIYNIGTCVITLALIVSCGTNKVTIDNTEVNAYPNSEYKKSTKVFSGTLNKLKYDELIIQLEKELKTRIPDGKSVLINYNQKAPNCIDVRFSEKSNELVTNNRIRISSRISSNYNALDFFIYTNDSYHKNIYEKLDEFILDSGFFFENVFTEHQNCSGFMIIRPNGEFLKYYGEDYYSEVKEFFEKN